MRLGEFLGCYPPNRHPGIGESLAQCCRRVAVQLAGSSLTGLLAHACSFHLFSSDTRARLCARVRAVLTLLTLCNFGALRYSYIALCSFQTSCSHNSDSSCGSANKCRRAGMLCARQLLSRCRHGLWWLFRSCELTANIVFRDSEHHGLSAPMVTWTSRNRLSLSMDPSRLCHSFARC